MNGIPEWLRDVPPLTDAEFAAFDQRMSEKQHEEDRASAEELCHPLAEEESA